MQIKIQAVIDIERHERDRNILLNLIINRLQDVLEITCEEMGATVTELHGAVTKR
jgi:hypothetical protein